MSGGARGGFALLTALLVAIAIAAIAAAVIAPNIVATYDRERVENAAARLSEMTDGPDGLVRFVAEVGKYPLLLTHLSRPITIADLSFCGTTYNNGDVGGWTGRYEDQVLVPSGVNLGIGIAKDTLSRVVLSATAELLIIRIPGVSVEDAESMDRRTDTSNGSTNGRVQWGAVASDGTVTLSWVTEVTSKCGGGGGGGGGKNTAPTSSFTFACTGLTCNFTDTSTDTDGSIVGWSWDFGTGATSISQNPSYTYAASGTYTVTLTVTDNAGATGTSSQSVVVTAPGVIMLSVAGRSVKGSYFADLSWSGATSASVDISRNSIKIATVANSLIGTNTYTDSVGKTRGTYTYQVCVAGTTTCSNTASVTF